jgi:asparagine synthase (glutamine-hydrolysing)
VFEHHRQRAASAGLEARHPLFDLGLVELCLRQPPRATFDRTFSRPLFRAAMRGLVPEMVRMRPRKALFDSLLIDSVNGADGELARRLVCEPGAEVQAFVDRDAVERRLFAGGGEALPQNSFVRMCEIWRLATAEIWLRAGARGPEELARLRATAAPARVTLTTTGPARDS